MISMFRSKKGIGYLRVLSPYDEGRKTNYLHIDCTLKKAFSKDCKIQTTNKNNDVKSYIKKYYNNEVDVTIKGGFCFPLNKITNESIIFPFIHKHQDRNETVTIQLTQGELSITGTPITQINWTLQEEKKKAYIILRGEITHKIDKNYLHFIYEWINVFFNLFFISEEG